MRFALMVVVAPLLFASCAVAQEDALPSAEEVEAAIIRAATAFNELSYHGAYPYLLSGDLQTRYNCGHGNLQPFPDETYMCIEPPGTPWVGRAYLRAYRATGDERLLAMAQEVGDALATTQLAVGGWRMRQPLSDEWADSDCDAPGAYQRGAFADLDDSRSQGPALFFVELIRDGSTSERHREAMDKALGMLLEAQYPSGGWPQIYPPPENEGDYRRYHTLNDASMPNTMLSLLAAWRSFGEQRYLDAVVRGADWLLDARLPGAAWAQQYYDDFVTGPLIPNHPAPARWFEPIAITASESGAVLNVLTEVWLETGDDRYIEPFDEVVEWYERSRLEDGRWARFYALHTNRPLYCTPDRIITYSDESLRPGYGWKGAYGNRVLEIVERVNTLGRDGILAQRETAPDAERVAQLGGAAAAAIAALDERGLWVSERGPDDANIRTDEFFNRMNALSDYLEAIHGAE
ncbi:MAG: pectate lyase [Armatimonadota bacterium]|jgi:hypothetical protein